MQWAYCEIWKAKEDMVRLNQLAAGAWRAQVHSVDKAWRVFCYSCTQTLFSSGSFYRLEGGGEVFRRILRFPLR